MISKAQFTDYILPFTLKMEGGYANDPDDSGGETYRGITRRNNPSWIGWRIIDRVKPLHTGQTIKAVDAFVPDFYFQKYFVAFGFNNFNNTKVALSCFDFAVNGGFSHAKLKQILQQKYGKNTATNAAYYKAVNSVNADSLASDIIRLRQEHYQEVIKNKPKNKKFETGWKNRIAALRTYLNLPVIGLGMILLIAFATYLYYKSKGKLQWT